MQCGSGHCLPCWRLMTAYTDSRLMLVFCTTAGDDGKSEVIGFLHMRGVVSVDWAMDNCVVSGGAEN